MRRVHAHRASLLNCAFHAPFARLPQMDWIVRRGAAALWTATPSTPTPTTPSSSPTASSAAPTRWSPSSSTSGSGGRRPPTRAGPPTWSARSTLLSPWASFRLAGAIGMPEPRMRASTCGTCSWRGRPRARRSAGRYAAAAPRGLGPPRRQLPRAPTSTTSGRRSRPQRLPFARRAGRPTGPGRRRPPRALTRRRRPSCSAAGSCLVLEALLGEDRKQQEPGAEGCATRGHLRPAELRPRPRWGPGSLRPELEGPAR